MRISRFAVAASVGLALAASGALAQDATAPFGATLHLSPEPALTEPNGPTIVVPGSATRGFDAPPPALRLDLPASTMVRGLVPGQDLVGEAGPRAARPSAADTDSYFATKDFQDKDTTVEHKAHHVSVGKQAAQAGKGILGAAVLHGIGALISGD